jgi:predicted TIM-barrel fold metal-dependent hydrolase
MPFLTQPPDPNPRKPRLQLPAGAVDTHIHLFGPASQYSFHPQSKYTSADALPETYIALQDTLGLKRAVLVSGGGYGPNTAHLEDVLKRFPERFRGVALLSEDITPKHLKALDRLGVRGARFISRAHGGGVPLLSADVARRVADLGWHVQFYPHGTDLPEYADHLLSLPNDIVIDHFGCIPPSGGIEQPAFQRLLQMIDTGRVWVKLSGPMRCTRDDPPYSSMTPLARALVAHAPDRLVWGTDWPHVNMNDRVMPNDGDLVDLLGEWVPDAATREMILVSNPVRLYGFENRGSGASLGRDADSPDIKKAGVATPPRAITSA